MRTKSARTRVERVREVPRTLLAAPQSTRASGKFESLGGNTRISIYYASFDSLKSHLLRASCNISFSASNPSRTDLICFSTSYFTTFPTEPSSRGAVRAFTNEKTASVGVPTCSIKASSSSFLFNPRSPPTLLFSFSPSTLFSSFNTHH